MSQDGIPPNVREVLAATELLPASVAGIVAIALVGSWTRSAGRHDSDVDLVVLASAPDELLDTASWFSVFGEGVELMRSEDFGLLQERRLRRPDGLEVEVGIGAREWAATDPVDAGSARVVRDGMRILFDPEALLTTLDEAVRGR